MVLQRLEYGQLEMRAGRCFRSRLAKLPAGSVREGSEERRPLVWIAPFGAERRTAESILRGGAHCGIRDIGKGVEPLPRAATRVVTDFLLHRQSQRFRRHANGAWLIHELNC